MPRASRRKEDNHYQEYLSICHEIKLSSSPMNYHDMYCYGQEGSRQLRDFENLGDSEIFAVGEMV